MATDAADAVESTTERARPRATLPWEARLLLTLALLALYYFGHRLKLPLVNLGSSQSVSVTVISRLSLLSLGFTGLFSGFILVELFSVAMPPGRRLRQAGVSGRARLNRAALGTSLVLAAIQGLGIALFLQTTTNSYGEPLVPNPGLGFVLVTMATVAASTAAVFVLANLLSDYGIGNGFALLNLVEIGQAFVVSLVAAARLENISSAEQGFWLLGLAVLTFLLIRHVRAAEGTHTPALPQGILPLGWVSFVSFTLYSLLMPIAEALYIAAIGVLVVLLSWVCFHLFSSRPRLEANVPETADVLNGLADLLRRRLPLATALLAAGTVNFLVWQRGWPPKALAVSGFLSLCILLAIGFDLVEQYRFMKRNGPTTRLVQLDNVHFSYRLTARLEEEGIDALARGHVLRSLYFFFGPLYKIDVLVPEEDLEDARAVLGELEVSREAKVF